MSHSRDDTVGGLTTVLTSAGNRTRPFLLPAVAYLAAGGVLLGWLRPDPFLVAKALAELTADSPTNPHRQ